MEVNVLRREILFLPTRNYRIVSWLASDDLR